MALNPDPKPGRWILPLVVLGMVAFTYFFVRALPEGAEEPSDTSVSASDTTFPGSETSPEDSTPGSSAPTDPSLDPETQAYLDGVGVILTSMEDLQREMAAVNGGFDADPRTVEYGDAVDRLTVLAGQAGDLVGEIDALTVPESLATNHETIRNAVTTAAGAADEALAGLQSTDDGSQRRNAIEAFDSALSDLQTAVDNARSAAGLATTPPTTDTTEGTTDTTEGTTDTTTGDTTGDG